ncbi:hypothetical protein CP10743SC13_2075, partial [Chlamydia psittaci 10_743_SC13]
RFLFANPPVMQKSRVFSSRIPHLTLKSRVFSSEIPHLSENHVFSSRIPHLSEHCAFSLRKSPHLSRKTDVFSLQIS